MVIYTASNLPSELSIKKLGQSMLQTQCYLNIFLFKFKKKQSTPDWLSTDITSAEQGKIHFQFKYSMSLSFQKKIREVKWLQQILCNRGVSTEGKINSLHLVWITCISYTWINAPAGVSYCSVQMLILKWFCCVQCYCKLNCIFTHSWWSNFNYCSWYFH